MLDSTSSGENGITAHAASAGHHRHHRRHHEQELVRAGRHDDFLEQELDAVGNRLQQAQGPTRLGPMRTCIQPMTLRSSSVR
jgi:hypothetical protein